MSNSAVLQPNQPFKYASRNPRTHYKNLQSGEIFLLEVEIDEEVWDQVRTLPKNALLENISWHHDGDPTQPEPILGTMESPKEKPRKKEPSPHGEYWRRLRIWPIWTDPHLLEVLDCPADADRVWESLHTQLKTSSCALVSPKEFELWLEANALDGLVTVSRQVQARIEGAQI